MHSELWKEDNSANITLYSHLLEEFGYDHRSLNWGSREGQYLRFDVLSQVYPLQGMKILDVGCGIGDFYDWALKKGLEIDYTGIDITPLMIQKARQRFPGITFEVADILDDSCTLKDKFDIVVSSGVFAHRTFSPLEFLKNMTVKMFALSEKALAFNTLSAWAPDPDEGEFYAGPPETLAFCKTLTPWVTLKHDYHARDFTIFMYHRRRAGL